ncbi:MAG: amidohydrolase family protein [Oscillospiraceae bacterium]|nr:amidohydrolase family protein [Oscillospiraceae bacterium]
MPEICHPKLVIIDAHAHIFPDKIAAAAAGGIQRFYDMPVTYDGTADTLLAAGGAAGVTHFIVQSVATVPEQVESINQFIAEQVRLHPGQLTGLGAMHPACDVAAAFEQIAALGLGGVKLHPDFQQFNIDDLAAFPIYERAQAAGLPLLLHTGDYRYDYSHPRRLAAVLKRFPRLTVIAAHFGGWSVWSDAAKCLAGTGVYVDTCSSLYALEPKKARKLIDLFGEERVLFGTDYPMWEYGAERERFEALGLEEETKEKILYKNAQRLFGIETVV